MGLLLIRVAIAVVFIFHGWMKFQNMAGTIGFFHMIHVPAFMAYVVAAVELLGGIAMLLGMWVSVAGYLLAITMVFAILLVKIKIGFPAIEIDIAMLGASLGIAMVGAGRFSIKCPCGGKCPLCACGSTCATVCDKCAGCANTCTMHETK
jgi:putative oxidoreductase